MKNRLVQHAIQTIAHVPFLVTTSVLWDVEVVRVYFPFHHIESEKDTYMRVFPASSRTLSNETGVWHWLLYPAVILHHHCNVNPKKKTTSQNSYKNSSELTDLLKRSQIYDHTLRTTGL